MKGRVYFVGAGPGDPELITQKGLRLIKQADVLIYNRGINTRLLKWVREKTEIFKEEEFSKDEIYQLIIQRVNEGKRVVHLINGDPFVFGSGGKAALSFRSEQIPFEVVPGLPLAIAAPAYAGIPLTHHALSSSFAVIAEVNQRGSHGDQFAKNVETLIFLTKIDRLPFIVNQLIQQGYYPATPVAVIQKGATMEQNVIVGSLQNIEQKIGESLSSSLVVMIVGQVAQLHKKLRWFEKKPLFGRRILVTRARKQSKELVDRIAALGGEPVEFPVIQTVPPQQDQGINQALQRLDEFDWLIFTSVNGVNFFFKRMKEQKIDIRQLAGIKIAVVGSKTKDAIEEKGLFVDCIPEEYVAEALIETLRSVVSPGEKILFPRANIARGLLPDELKKMGCRVEAVDAYDTILASDHADELVKQLQEESIHIITFTSPSTVENFQKIIAMHTDDWQTLLHGVKIVCIGPITARTARKWGFTVDAVANPYTIDGLMEAIQMLEQNR